MLTRHNSHLLLLLFSQRIYSQGRPYLFLVTEPHKITSTAFTRIVHISHFCPIQLAQLPCQASQIKVRSPSLCMLRPWHSNMARVSSCNAAAAFSGQSVPQSSCLQQPGAEGERFQHASPLITPSPLPQAEIAHTCTAALQVETVGGAQA